MKRIIFALFILILLITPLHAQVKKADLAGKWYTVSAEMLESELRSYLEAATPPSIDAEIIALISPHAGFQYSGPVAAHGFKAVENQDIKTVIIVGFSHRKYYDGVAVLLADGFATPLGVAEIDREITRELINKNAKIYHSPDAFQGENALEMQIPFLQAALQDFRIVLISIGEQNPENCRLLAGALYDVLRGRDKFLLLASTDMCHYIPYSKAIELDANTTSLIEEFDPDKLYAESALKKHGLMCGYGAVCATMLAAEMLGGDKIITLKYANSGDTAGDKKSVVGYLSAAIVRQKKEKREGNMLDEKRRKRLLGIARKSIEDYVHKKEIPEFEEKDPELLKEEGAFVTIHNQGNLRGCIGNIIGRGPLYLTVRDMAIAAAANDHRFPPVSPGELAEIDIEISVLSKPERVIDAEEIEMGVHGVIIKKGFRSGVFLPQVATETGWQREEFLSNLCAHKAGLSPDAWKDKDTEIYIFTAEVFGEK